MFTLSTHNDVQGSVFTTNLTPNRVLPKLDQLRQLYINYLYDLCCTIIIFCKTDQYHNNCSYLPAPFFLTDCEYWL